jgi:hypothetical protein
MPLDLNELEAAVLALPPEQRGRIAKRLLASLDNECDPEHPAVVERAWIEEVKRREHRFLAGETREVPAAEALARVRAGLRRA